MSASFKRRCQVFIINACSIGFAAMLAADSPRSFVSLFAVLTSCLITAGLAVGNSTRNGSPFLELEENISIQQITDGSDPEKCECR